MRPFVFAAAASLVLAAAPVALADHKGKIPWVEGYEQGIQKARMTGKPTMLFFTADW